MLKEIKLFILFFVGVLHAYEVPDREYRQYVHEVVSDFVGEIEKKYDLFCIGSGGGMPQEVCEISVLFASRKKCGIEEVREMEVEAVELLLKKINAHKKLRPFLREHPFDSRRVDINISFRDKHGDSPCDGSVARVFLARNKIFYKEAQIVQNERFPEPEEEYFLLLEEPYEEALKLIQKKKKGV